MFCPSFRSAIGDLELLKKEASEKKFPDNELLHKLNTVLKDIKRCQLSSTELLGPSKTRCGTATHTRRF